MMHALVILGTVMLANLGPGIMGFREFTDRPKVPFEATTFEQDALVRDAEGMRGDNREKEPVAACDALIADETLPFELRSWAVRQKMKLCTYASRTWEAIEAGRAWLDAHGDEDPYAKEIRVMLGHIMAQRGHPGFVPLHDDAKAVFEDIFEHHPPDTMMIIDSHVNYAMLLERLAWTNEALKVLAINHCTIAVGALESHLEEQGEELSETLRGRYERRIKEINALSRRLMKRGSPNMTEQEYVDFWSKREERGRNAERRDRRPHPHEEIMRKVKERLLENRGGLTREIDLDASQ